MAKPPSPASPSDNPTESTSGTGVPVIARRAASKGTAQILPWRTNSSSPLAASFGDAPSIRRWRVPVASSTASMYPGLGGWRFCTSTAFEPGRTSASRNCPISSLAAMMVCTAPPLAGTRERLGRTSTIVPSSAQSARARTGASVSTTGVPPSSGTRLSWPSAKKPIDRPSGEKNGRLPPSVPRIGSAVRSPSRRRTRPGPVPETT